MTISLPAYYMSDAARKKAQGDALREGLDDASKQAIGGFDMMAKLQQQLEQKDYGRAKDQRDESRADERFAAEKEDRKRRMAKEDADAAAKKQARESPNVEVAADVMQPGEMNDAFSMIKKQLAEGDGASPAAPTEPSDDLGADVHAYFPGDLKPEQTNRPAKKGAITPDDLDRQMKEDRARILHNKANPKVGAESEVSKAKKQKAIDEAAIVAAKRKAIESPPVGDGLEKSTRGDFQKKRAAAREAKAQTQALRTIITQNGLEQYTGPLDQVGQFLERKSGMQGRQAAMVQAAIIQAAQIHRHAMTGAAANAQEMEEGNKVSIDLKTDNLQSALGKLDAADRLADAADKFWSSQLGGAGGAGASSGVRPSDAHSDWGD